MCFKTKHFKLDPTHFGTWGYIIFCSKWSQQRKKRGFPGKTNEINQRGFFIVY